MACFLATGPTRHILGGFAVLALAGCSGAADEEGSSETVETAAADIETAVEEASGQAGTDGLTPREAADPPTQYKATAWRTTGEDGAVYTTYLNADGTYRDLRNGDEYQTGQWTLEGEDRLCLAPDEQRDVGGCWSAGSVRGDSVVMTRNDGTRVEVRKVEYLIPENQLPTDEATDDADG